jgi:hypothetical protein
MKIKLLLLLAAVISLVSCDGENGQGTSPDDVVETNDDNGPILSITGLSESMETYTDIEAVVSDESSVETRIFINGEEVFQTSDVQFNYRINPYLIPVGEIQLRVVCEDEFENTTEKLFQLEIKHLLIEFNLGRDEEERYETIWTFFNDSDGNLLTSQKVEQGSVKVYTDKIVPDDYVLYTIAKYEILGSEGQSRALRNTTYRLPLGEVRNPIVYNQEYNLQNYVDVEIALENDNVQGYQLYTGGGAEYDLYKTGGGSFLEIVGFKYDAPDHIYLRTDILGGPSGLFDGKKENYGYYRFVPDLSRPVISIDESDLIPADESVELQLPDHTEGSFRILRSGFESDTYLASNADHEIYEVLESGDVYLDNIDLPILQGLTSYSNTVQYQFEGKGYYSLLFGNEIDIAPPNWELNFGLENNKIFIEENNDLDYYMVQLRKDDTSDFTRSRYWTWNYRAFGSDDENIPIPLLALPDNLISEINDSHYTDSNSLNLERVYAVEFSGLESYNQSIQWLGLNQIPLATEQEGFKEVIFYHIPVSAKRKIGTSISEHQNPE